MTVTVHANEFVWIEEIIEIVEKQASCELYGLLKRPDEKFVTEKAYDNPKFVEDMVRDIATELKNDKRIKSFVVESENFESKSSRYVGDLGATLTWRSTLGFHWAHLY